jgi:hypothetical protein
VIFFGALISMGNERQRRAIDGLREQVVLWAVQDLRVKREMLAQEMSMEDPLDWFNRIVAKITGRQMRLRLAEAIDDWDMLVFKSEDGEKGVVFSRTSPDEVHRARRERRGKLSGLANNPLFSLPLHAAVCEITVLNGGVFFDLELPRAWKALTGAMPGNMERIWMDYGKGAAVRTDLRLPDKDYQRALRLIQSPRDADHESAECFPKSNCSNSAFVQGISKTALPPSARILASWVRKASEFR